MITITRDVIIESTRTARDQGIDALRDVIERTANASDCALAMRYMTREELCAVADLMYAEVAPEASTAAVRNAILGARYAF